MQEMKPYREGVQHSTACATHLGAQSLFCTGSHERWMCHSRAGRSLPGIWSADPWTLLGKSGQSYMRRRRGQQTCRGTVRSHWQCTQHNTAEGLRAFECLTASLTTAGKGCLSQT